jgi:phosphoserine phosphatase RsbU/P
LFNEPGLKLQTPAWRHFLALGEKLISLTSVTSQADLIKHDIQGLGPYEADIWFTELVARIPGSHSLSIFPPIPPTPLMQKVKQDLCTCIIGKGGNPKQDARSEPPYVVAYPLLVGEAFLGIIQIARTDSSPFHRDELDLLEGLSANAALALQVSHQSIIKNWRWEQLSLVRMVSSQIANMVELDQLCEKVTTLIRESFHFYAVNIFTIDPNTENLHAHPGAGPLDLENGTDTTLEAKIGNGMIGKVAETGIEIVANDALRDPDFIHIPSLPLTRAEAVFPLKIEDRILGVLDIQSDHIYTFHEVDMLVLRSLADNIALAVEGARLYSAIGRRADQLSIVSEVGKALSSILDFNQLLEQIVEIITERFKYPYVHLYLVQKDTQKLVYRAGAGSRAEILDQMGLQYDIEDTQGILPWVVRNGATVIANDVTQDPLYRPNDFGPTSTISEMAVPLIFGGEVLGVLDLQSDLADEFDLADRELFETLGGNIAIAIRNSILFNSEKWRRQASDSLREVAGLLPKNIAVEQLLDAILTELEQILPCQAAAIWLVDEEAVNEEDGDYPLKLAAVHGIAPETVIKSCCEEPICTAWLEQALVMPNPTVRCAGDPYGPLGMSLKFEPDYSSIAAPLRIGNNPVGIITLAHQNPNRYGIESIQMTAAFANYAAVAIQNARLFASAQEQAWIATVLLQVAEATQSITSVDDLLQTVVRLTPMLVGVTGCGLFLWEPELERFGLAGTHGIDFDPEWLNQSKWIKPEDIPALEQVFLNKQSVEITDHETQFPHLQISDSQTNQLEYKILPLLSHGDLMGACIVAIQQSRNGMMEIAAENRHAIIQGIAHQTAIAIENIRLLERQQQETYVSAVLLQVAQIVVSHNDLSDLYASVTQIVPMLVGSQTCLLFLWNEVDQTYRLVESVGIDRGTRQYLSTRVISPDEARLLEYICTHNQSVLVPLQDLDIENPGSWMNLPVDRIIDQTVVGKQNRPVLIGAPLGVKDDNYGAMIIVETGERMMYFQKRFEIITGIAQQTAMAIQNERLQEAVLSQERLEREFQLAREIQQTFLPDHLPQPEGWQVDARWRPAREVGGDFYDLFWITPHQMAIVIADVSDKGISAALYMTLTRTLFRTVAQQKHEPAQIFAQVNELLLRDTPHGMFVTAVMGVIDLHTGRMVYANAGHNLPILWRKANSGLDKLEKGSMPLGIIENVNFINHETQLHHGDTMLLYTDGITDTYVNQELFGEERLEAAILSDNIHEARSILGTIDQALMDFQGSGQPADDVTAVTLHRI